MENQKEILDEIKQLKDVISKLIGTSDLPPKDRFSIQSVEKAATEFKKLSIARDEWLEGDKISKYFKGAPWNAGKFIVKEFEFKNYFRKGNHYYYLKEDIIELAKELKDRDVNLDRYMDLIADKEIFQKKVDATLAKEAAKGKKKPYKLPKDAKDISTTPLPKPKVEVVRADIKRLKDEFFEHKLDQYIDIYNGNYAMTKDPFYRYKTYMDKDLPRRINKWKDEFNNANSVLKEITKKKEIFIPIPETEIIKL
jgi:hypothetical protein